TSRVLRLHGRGKLVWVGNAGTGFNNQSLRMLWSKMQPLVTNKRPFDEKVSMLRSATWLEPKLVCECKFVEWTKDGKLRAPVYLGLRTDKRPEECVREGEEPAEE